MARNHGNIVLNCEDVKVLYDGGELDTRGPFQITHNWNCVAIKAIATLKIVRRI